MFLHCAGQRVRPVPGQTLGLGVSVSLYRCGVLEQVRRKPGVGGEEKSYVDTEPVTVTGSHCVGVSLVVTGVHMLLTVVGVHSLAVVRVQSLTVTGSQVGQVVEWLTVVGSQLESDTVLLTVTVSHPPVLDPQDSVAVFVMVTTEPVP